MQGPTPRSITRRQLAAGAAWTVPALTVAAAAPVMAVSGPRTCVTMAPSTWTTETSNNASAGGVYWDPSQTNTTHQYPPGFTVNADPPANDTYWATITTTIHVVAGRTYSFSVDYEKFIRNPLTATGTVLINGTTYGSITTTGLPLNGTLPVTYRATTTGTISFALRVTIPATSNQTSGDDITWESVCYTSDWT